MGMIAIKKDSLPTGKPPSKEIETYLKCSTFEKRSNRNVGA